MLLSTLLQPVSGPVLNSNAHGLNVQMVYCNLLRSLDATLSSRAAQGHSFQLIPPPHPPPVADNWNLASIRGPVLNVFVSWVKAGRADKAEQQQ